MAAMIRATQPPTGGIDDATHLRLVGLTRREGPSTDAPGDAARELDHEVTRLLRVRRGELAEPLLWQRPSYRGEIDLILHQLSPIRSRLALLSSWERESRRDAPLRLAYAILWLRLAHRRAGDYGPRLREVTRRRVLRARG